MQTFDDSASSMGSDLAEQLAGMSAAFDLDAVPAEVVDLVTTLIVDAVGAALAGLDAEGVKQVRAQALEWGGAEQSTIWGDGRRVPAPLAALVNGTMIHALEFDDLHDEGHVHTLSVILPAALAAAQLVGEVDGRALLRAVIIGCEVMCRLGVMVPVERGWHYTATYGVFGAAAAAAHLLRLDTNRTTDALGIALSHAAGTKQPVLEPSLVKRMHPGFAAQGGVTAALLASRGVNGPRSSLEGRFGYFRTYEPEAPRRDRATEGLGVSFELLETRLKPYPCCGYNHAPIDAAVQLVNQYRPELAAIREITVYVSATAARIVGAPFPKDAGVSDAQFSLAYSVATALVRGKVGLSDFTPEAISDPVVGEMARLVSVRVGEGIPVRSAAPVSISVKLANGSEISATADRTRGGRDHPLSDAERHAKLIDCLRYGGVESPESLASRISGAAAGLARGESSQGLIACLTGSPEANAAE